MKALDGIKRRLSLWIKQPKKRPRKAVQADSRMGDVPQPMTSREIVSLRLLYERAILMHICREPRKFSFDPAECTTYDYAAKAISLGVQLAEAIARNGGRMEGVTDPTMPVWRTMAKLTEIDFIGDRDEKVEESVEPIQKMDGVEKKS